MSYLLLYPKDIRRFPDYAHLSKSSLYRLYNRMKAHYEREKHQKITVAQFADYVGLPEAGVVTVWEVMGMYLVGKY
jgi:hypothetical protein